MFAAMNKVGLDVLVKFEFLYKPTGGEVGSDL